MWGQRQNTKEIEVERKRRMSYAEQVKLEI